jgi:ApaG protein
MTVTRSEAVTRDIRVKVRARFSPEHSSLAQPLWFFVYTIELINEGPVTVQLLHRHWEITDANGRVEHVRGPGVVGEQPVLKPGQSFEYTSGCPLPTAFGFMRGEYRMVVEGTGEAFDAEVSGFPLRQNESALN